MLNTRSLPRDSKLDCRPTSEPSGISSNKQWKKKLKQAAILVVAVGRWKKNDKTSKKVKNNSSKNSALGRNPFFAEVFLDKWCPFQEDNSNLVM